VIPQNRFVIGINLLSWSTDNLCNLRRKISKEILLFGAVVAAIATFDSIEEKIAWPLSMNLKIPFNPM